MWPLPTVPLQKRSVAVYEASSSQAPTFSVYLQSETQVQRAGTHWQRHLEAQGGSLASSYMCGEAGKMNRGKEIGKAVGIALAVAVVYNLGLVTWDKYTGGQSGILGFVVKGIVSIGLAIYDEVGDWTFLRALADSGNAWLVLRFGMMLFGAMLIVHTIFFAVWLVIIYCCASRKEDLKLEGKRVCSMLPQLYSLVTLAVGLGLVVANFKNLDSLTTCIHNPAAVCKPQAQHMFYTILKAALPALVGMHIWHVLVVFYRARPSTGQMTNTYHAYHTEDDQDDQCQRLSNFQRMLAEALFIIFETIPQVSYQAYVWHHGYAYITPSAYLISAVGSFTSIFVFVGKLVTHCCMCCRKLSREDEMQGAYSSRGNKRARQPPTAYF